MFGPALLHSVSYSGSWGQASLSLSQFVDKAADLGFDGVMLMAKRPHLSPLDYDASERAALREQIEQRGLKQTVIAAYTNFTADLEHAEVPHREIQILYVSELARLARDLGANYIRIFTGYDNPVSSYLAQWNLIVSTLRECAQRCAASNVTLGVQNHHDVGVGWQTTEDLIHAVNEPNCRAMFDAWAPALQCQDLREAARRLGPVSVHTTVADYQLRPRYRYNAALVNYELQTSYSQAVPMGEGFIDYDAFFQGLAEAGFRGSVAYEMCSPLLHGGAEETLDRYARTFLDYYRRLCASTQPVGAHSHPVG